MRLYDEICSFLDRHALEYAEGVASGLRIIHINESSAIIPLQIRANDMTEAGLDADALSEAVREIQNRYGEYPLIITEDRWRAQPHMMHFRLLAHLRIFTQIYARNCEVRKIDKQTATDFLSANHSYGDASCRYRYGLFLKRHTGHNSGAIDISPGTLMAVATFSNARKWFKGEKVIRSYEWTRYASLPQVRLSGGMGKLLNAFIQEVGPDDIMTYADLEWSEGKVYETLGFRLEEVKEPVGFVVDGSWKRFPIKPEMPAGGGNLYFQNLGSNKYRLKLTDYQ